jgi:ATP-binding cassette subfamily B protein
MPLVQAFAAQRYETSYYERFMDRTVESEKRERIVTIFNKMHQGLSIALLGLALIPASIFLFLRGGMTVGDFVIVTALLPALTGVIWTFADNVLRSIRTYGGLKNAVLSLRSHVQPVEDGPRQMVLDRSPAITFKNIVFVYPGSKEKVFDGLSLALRGGEKVGLVGRSGVGKSTLVKLLLRNYDPDSGAVLVAGEGIASFTLDSLRRNISFVPQDTSLFHRTLYENILFAQPEASRDQVMTASRRAHAHDFIESYPEKYDTKVGERGVKLSGGQKQRIALARAMLKDAPILVLDEATSALDSESEEIVQKGLQELFQGRTVLAIAHRLSTLRSMDRIIVLEEGAVVEDGSPQDLLVRDKGIFRDMWEHQKSGFIAAGA